jgi:hypothetical protein
MTPRWQRRPSPQGRHDGGQGQGNRKPILAAIAALLLFATIADAGTFRVHYSIRGSGRDVTVQAESSAEARRTVMDMFPGAVVTGIHKIRR